MTRMSPSDEMETLQRQNARTAQTKASPAMTAGGACHMPPGLGDMTPDFTATTTDGVKTLSGYRGKWVILFSHPGDFTPVCTTEFLAFAKRYQDFKDRNTELLGLSIDSNASHIAWVINIYRRTGVEIPFPVIDDRDMRIAKMYGMIQPGVSGTETVRNVFYIDPNGVLRAKLIYPLTNGRSIGEILRLLEALQTTDAEKVATPANWRPGYPTIMPPPKTVDAAMKRLDSGANCMDWYLCFNPGTKGRLDNANDNMNNMGRLDNANSGTNSMSRMPGR